MSKVFICSDIHWGHKNIATWRGFSSVEEHNNLIMTNWNKTVHKRDKVFILGDITMESKDYGFLDSLHGSKTVILGNHDKPGYVRELLNHVEHVAGCMKYKGVWLSHIPIHPQELRGLKNCHGHTHSNNVWHEDSTTYINICMDVINYTPVLFDEIINRK